MIEFILIAAISQSILLGFYFFSKRNKYAGYIYQSELLFIIAICIFSGYMYGTHKILDYPILARIGFLFMSLIGGFVYVATKSIVTKSNRFGYKDGFLFIVPLLIFLYLLPFYLSGTEAKLNYLKEDIIELHTDCLLISIAGSMNNFFGIALSIKLLFEHSVMKSRFYYLLALTGTIIPLIISLLNKNFINSGYYSLFISALIIFRSYEIIFRVPSNRKENLFFGEKEKYERSRVKQETIRELGIKIKNYFETDKPYLDPDFTVKTVTELFNITPNTASQVFTDFFQKSFYQIVNEYRIREVILRLSEKKNLNGNILNLAFDCGFNSKSTFNESFKKITGKSPRDYKKRPV